MEPAGDRLGRDGPVDGVRRNRALFLVLGKQPTVVRPARSRIRELRVVGEQLWRLRSRPAVRVRQQPLRRSWLRQSAFRGAGLRLEPLRRAEWAADVRGWP